MALMVRNWNVYLPLTTWSSSDCFCLDNFPRRLLLRPHSPSPVQFCAFPGHSRQLLHPRGGKDTKSVPSSKKWGYGSLPLPTPRPSLAPQDPAAASPGDRGRSGPTPRLTLVPPRPVPCTVPGRRLPPLRPRGAKLEDQVPAPPSLGALCSALGRVLELGALAGLFPAKLTQGKHPGPEPHPHTRGPAHPGRPIGLCP